MLAEEQVDVGSGCPHAGGGAGRWCMVKAKVFLFSTHPEHCSEQDKVETIVEGRTT